MDGIIDLGFEYECNSFLGWCWISKETYTKRIMQSIAATVINRFIPETSEQPLWTVIPAKGNFLVVYAGEQKYYVDNLDQLKELMKKKNDEL